MDLRYCYFGATLWLRLAKPQLDVLLNITAPLDDTTRAHPRLQIWASVLTCCLVLWSQSAAASVQIHYRAVVAVINQHDVLAFRGCSLRMSWFWYGHLDIYFWIDAFCIGESTLEGLIFRNAMHVLHYMYYIHLVGCWSLVLNSCQECPELFLMVAVVPMLSQQCPKQERRTPISGGCQRGSISCTRKTVEYAIVQQYMMNAIASSAVMAHL